MFLYYGYDTFKYFVICNIAVIKSKKLKNKQIIRKNTY